MYRVTREEALRLTVNDVSAGTPPYTQEEALQWLKKARREPQMFEWLARDTTGRKFWVEVNIKRARVGGKEILLAIVRDITRRKRGQRALQRAYDQMEQRVQERTAELAKAKGCHSEAHQRQAEESISPYGRMRTDSSAVPQSL